MKYYRFVTEQHMQEIDTGAMTAYYEVNSDNVFSRSMEVYQNGQSLSYDVDHTADDYGIMPDQDFDLEAAKEFGELTEISAQDFESVWSTIEPINR
ncbi:MAG: hypothetical protein M0Z56_04895 [Desulfobacteraceae bacterium]|nr:hypothetical protein [Desulfobacteraceae bacterium]